TRLAGSGGPKRCQGGISRAPPAKGSRQRVRRIGSPFPGKCRNSVMMEYKGYTGQITAVDEAQGIIHGEVTGINDIVTFEGKSPEELVQAFHDSVDDYLEFWEQRSESPEKPYSGKFLVSISPALHQQASLAAKKAGESLNAWVASAIKAQLGKEGAKAG